MTEGTENSTLFGPLAEIANEITPEEWAFFDLSEDISDQIAEFMQNNDISKADLAVRLDSSRAFVTKVLRGESNMTFKTFTKILHHLGAKAEIKIARRQDGIRWFVVHESDRRRGARGTKQNYERVDFELAAKAECRICLSDNAEMVVA
ncbi:helix-turn-helix domain-containing protein [Desulfocurvus vexinensis]|uniref:helix-turn-helix domain-containing protein n=1 Tax=Desulfocurvus vexinensis TaxID=399548 RepID=UPI000551862F|nr:helix-turn-helix domain-containing protein [Desulfocurvus vexinensis]